METLSNKELLKENILLKTKIQEQNAYFQEQKARFEEQISYLEEQINWFKKQIFGKKSEKTIEPNPEQLIFPDFEDFFKKPEVESTQEVKSHKRKKYICNGNEKFSFPDDLPTKQIFLDLPEDKKISKTGEPLVKIGEEITRKLAYEPGTYFIKEFIRPKYAEKDPEEGIKIEELPSTILPKSLVDESLLSSILTMKFADHLPLYRIREIFFRDGIRISKQLLSQWVLRIGKNLVPLYDLMFQKVLKSERLFVDETPISLLVPGKKKVHQAYSWVYVGGDGKNPPYRIFEFCLNRKAENAEKRLGSYKGFYHSDKYKCYENLAKDEDRFWCPCMAHVRRKFIEAQSDPGFRIWVLRKIKYLYWLEKIAWNRSKEERMFIRSEKEEPIIDELIEKIKNKLIHGNVLPKSKFREALSYFYGLIPYLKNYLKHPDAHIDNNVAERAIRPLAIGRKNWLFAGSEDGGKAAAVILSLVQTCRNLNVNPRDYLEDIMRRIMDHPVNRLHELLPDEWAKIQNS